MNRFRGSLVGSLAACVGLIGASLLPAAPAGAVEAPPIFVTEWGATGSGNGQFNHPGSVAVDGSGTSVYVGDVFNSRIQKFDSDGAFQTAWGGFAHLIAGVAVDGSGDVYVGNRDGHTVKKFDSDGGFITEFGSGGTGDGQFQYPHGVAVDGSGNVYVVDTYNHRIQKFDSSHTFVTEWGAQGSGDGEFQYPIGVGLDPSGTVVYVSDGNNNRIQKFDSDGTFLGKWGTPGSGDGEFSIPGYGPAVDASGNVYVADQGNNRIQKFDSDGVFLAEWGDLGTGDGQFDNPTGVAVDGSGNVYVADYNNNRIQKFSYTVTDGTDPTISITTPSEGANYALDQEVLADYSCDDEGGSGLDSCVGDVADGSAIDTASTGAKTFTVDATDGAANSASLTVNYTVGLGVQGTVIDGQGFAIKFPLDVHALACPDTVTFEIGCADGVDVSTDGAGGYFLALEAGDYEVGGWVDGYLGPLVGDPVPVTVVGDPVDQDLEVAVPIIKGTILDPVGLPFPVGGLPFMLVHARACLAPHDVVFGADCSTPGFFADIHPDSTGDYRVQVVPDGTYNVNAAVRIGFVPIEYVEATQVTTLELGEGDVFDLDFEIPVPGISGTILDRNGDPVPAMGAVGCTTPFPEPPASCPTTVPSVRDQSTGVYHFFDLDPGTYFIALFGNAGGALVGNGPGPAAILTGSNSLRFDAVWDSSISAHVVAADGVTPVDNAAVTFRVGGNTGRAGVVDFTGASGNFTTPDLPAGTFDLTIFKPGHPSVRIDDVVVGSSDDVDLGTIVLEPPPPLPLTLIPDEGVPSSSFTARVPCTGLATATMTDADENVVSYGVKEGLTSGVVIQVPPGTAPGEYTVVGVCNQNYDGYNGYLGYNGYNGYGGYNGYNCYNGYNGYSGYEGYSGYSGYGGYGCVVHYGPATYTVLEPPVLTVSPHTGLIDGQAVDVSGAGFRPDQPVSVLQCVGAAIPGTNPPQAPCNLIGSINPGANGAGAFGPVPFTVHQPLLATNQGDQPYDCTVVACILVGSQGSLSNFFDFQNLDFDPNGIGSTVEDGAPNGGDGNNDGTPDSEQPHVASFPEAVNDEYVTISVPDGLTLVDVTATDVPPTAPPTPNGETFPIGLLGFEVHGVAPGGSVDVTIQLPAGTAPNAYLKLHDNVWVDFTGNVDFNGDTITLHLTDGGLGDDDDTVNGVIVDPGGPAIAVSSSVTALSNAHAWVGLKNSDDQGTQFDVRVELLKNGTPVASGLQRCITGVTRNPAQAKDAIVGWGAFAEVPLSPGDVLALRVSTRIGTKPDNTKCSGHNNAVGLRLYYDAVTRASRFGATISGNPSADLYLRSNGNPCNSESTGVTSRTLSPTPPSAAQAKCKDSTSINFSGGNLWKEIGTWSLAPQP